MDTYIILTNWTQKGIEGVKDSPDRLDAAKKAFEVAGSKIINFYLVTGRYDMVVIAEAPDSETVAKLARTIGKGGAVRTETLIAYTEEEYRSIIAALA